MQKYEKKRVISNIFRTFAALKTTNAVCDAIKETTHREMDSDNYT
jgi:hypothetical protein